MKTIPILVLLLLLPLASAIDLTVEMTAMDTYIVEKTKYANTQDWGAYDNVEGNFYVIIDDQPYLLQIINGQVKEVKAGVPNSYDYKITTTTENADKWWAIAEYYMEHGKLTWWQKCIEIPILKLQTPVQKTGTYGNIAFMATSVGNVIIHET